MHPLWQVVAEHHDFFVPCSWVAGRYKRVSPAVVEQMTSYNGIRPTTIPLNRATAVWTDSDGSEYHWIDNPDDFQQWWLDQATTMRPAGYHTVCK